jgi:hypothetical protein
LNDSFGESVGKAGDRGIQGGHDGGMKAIRTDRVKHFDAWTYRHCVLPNRLHDSPGRHHAPSNRHHVPPNRVHDLPHRHHELPDFMDLFPIASTTFRT